MAFPFHRSPPRPIPFHRHDVGPAEAKALLRVLRSGWINTGPETAAFEKDLSALTGSVETVCLSSATAGLFLALKASGVGPGDGVVVPVYTYSATAAAVVHAGATPIPADVDGHGLLSPECLARALTPRTRAVIAVDLGGLPAHYRDLRAVLSNHVSTWQTGPRDRESIPGKLGRPLLVADAAHSLGAKVGTTPVGTLADITVFSFHAVKNITTGDGGAVTFGMDPGLSAPVAKAIRLWALHGQTKTALEKMAPGRFEYDIAVPGYKFNMTDLAAALGRAQLGHLPAMERAKNAIADRYDGRFKAHPRVRPQPRTLQDRIAAPHLYRVQVDGFSPEGRDAFIRHGAESGISLNVHYRPLGRLSAWQNLGWNPESFPQADALWANEVSLPLYPAMGRRDVDRVLDLFKDLN